MTVYCGMFGTTGMGHSGYETADIYDPDYFCFLLPLLLCKSTICMQHTPQPTQQGRYVPYLACTLKDKAKYSRALIM